MVIRGHEKPHEFSFVQQVARMLYLIEPANFITRQRIAARDHAVWAAYAFGDVAMQYNGEMTAFALARVGKDQRTDPMVRYGIEALEKVSTVIDWTSQSVRNDFLKNRDIVARS